MPFRSARDASHCIRGYVVVENEVRQLGAYLQGMKPTRDVDGV